MLSLSEVTDFDLWAAGIISLAELENEGSVLNNGFCNDHDWRGPIEEDNISYKVCRNCFAVIAVKDDPIHVVTGPDDTDAVMMKMILAE